MHRILVVQTAFLGDLILTSPLFRAIKQADPDCYLTAMIRPEYREIVRVLPEVDELIYYDKHRRERGWLGFYNKIREVRLRSIEGAVSPHRSARTSLLLWRAGIPRRIGFVRAELDFLYSDRVQRDVKLHEVDRNLSLLRALGRNPEDFDRIPTIPVQEEWKTEAARLLPDSPGWVGIAPSSAWPTKQWIPSGFSRLLEMIENSLDLRTVILGEAEAEGLAQKIISQSDAKPLNLAGRTSLGALVAVIDRLKLLVSNDSALVHVASALGVPCVVIYGPTSPELGFGPLSPGSRTVEVPLDCRPCSPHGPRRCPRRHFKCMEEITSDQVFQEVQKAWAFMY